MNYDNYNLRYMILYDSAAITLCYDVCIFVRFHHTNQFLCILAGTNQVQSTKPTLNNEMVYLDLQLLVSRSIYVEVCVCTDQCTVNTHYSAVIHFQKFGGLISLAD